MSPSSFIPAPARVVLLRLAGDRHFLQAGFQLEGDLKADIMWVVVLGRNCPA